MKILCILGCVLGILSPTTPACVRDLGLVVDTTRSLKERTVPDLKTALTDLVQKFDISEYETHVSLETFAKKGKVKNHFKDSSYWSENAITSLIDDSINTLKSPTRLDNALEKANNDMFTTDNGDRPGVKNALVLFTDGRTNKKTENSTLERAIEDLKNKGVLLIAVAIGPDSSRQESQKVLKQIAGDNVFKVTNDPMQTMADVFDLICPCIRDLGLVVDTTESLKEQNVPVLKGALTDLVQKFDISENTTHVSLETFAKRGEVKNHFHDSYYWSVNAITDLINTTINTLSSPTRLDRALQEANNDMFTTANGDRPGEKNALVLFTDGRTNSKTDNSTLESAIEDLKNKGVLLIAVAIGPDSSKPESQAVLKQIAGGNVFSVTSDPMVDVFDLICRSSTNGRTSAMA